MDLSALNLAPVPVHGAVPVQSLRINGAELLAVCKAAAAEGGVLHALWGSDERDRNNDFLLHVALQHLHGLLVIQIPVAAVESSFPDLAEIFPAANRMQRAIDDLMGLTARNGDSRPWLRHAAWPVGWFPLRRDAGEAHIQTETDERYRFVTVKGDGVHEIAVGPVHAGIIEPGHFRFSVVGEKVLRLEERFGYTHKGIEQRLEGRSLVDGQQLAARVSGDSAVAFSWAYCMAAEAACHVSVPARAAWLRALCLERERIANHLGDLGALGNDAGFAIALAQFSRLKEDLLRNNARVFGTRYLFDTVVPGGTTVDLNVESRVMLLQEIPLLVTQLETLREIYDDHAGLQDRFAGTGRVSPILARKLGIVGLAARASGDLRDLRVDHPCTPYDTLDVRAQHRSEGDVAARVAIRFDEIVESLRLCQIILECMPPGDTRIDLPSHAPERSGFGWIEGWRGPVFVALETDRESRIRRCHPHDPSWQNWPALEHAIIGNIVPDFPLINKSFNLSYSGQDL